ncbi:hypothetical protein EVAR_83761_1 [Eumeta japonica]|uniref:Mos1 transposase HTH domain-containing protein n=1 Tax=Eumeta variegata TaxID=151549 RepID=A0A4C1WH20_EUMVA|nr:hypothetical protein EVAR_83761_1 [Eumeta japonica]
MDLSSEDFCGMIFYDFKCNLTSQQSLARLRTVFGDEASRKTIIYNRFSEFKCGRVNLSNEFREGRPSTAVNNKNIDTAPYDRNREACKLPRFSAPYVQNVRVCGARTVPEEPNANQPAHHDVAMRSKRVAADPYSSAPTRLPWLLKPPKGPHLHRTVLLVEREPTPQPLAAVRTSIVALEPLCDEQVSYHRCSALVPRTRSTPEWPSSAI